MSADATKAAPPDPLNPPTTNKTPILTTQPQEKESRLRDLTEMVAALRARRQASLGRWVSPQ